MGTPYFHRSGKPFTLWKWLVFGSLFLYSVNLLSGWAGELVPMAVFLGFAISVRISVLPIYPWLLKVLAAWGLSILISAIASLLLLGTCLFPTKFNFCSDNQLWAEIFSNFSFPLVFVLGWSVLEVIQSLKKWLNYLSIRRRIRKIR